MTQPHNRRPFFSFHARVRVAVGPLLSSRACSTLGIALVLAVGGCRNALRSLGTDATVLEANADQLFGALTARYSHVARDRKYEFARNRLNRTALVPSKIFDDTAVWTGHPSPVLRQLAVQGGFDGARYALAARPNVVRPARPGDARHVMTLARLGPNEYLWDTDVAFSLGTFPAAAVGSLVAGLLGSPEGRSEAQIRADYRTVAPRATAALGTLFTVDSILASPFSDGSTDVSLIIGIHADTLKKRYSAFGEYVAKYINPARYRISLTDRGGASWFDVTGAEQRVRVHYRTSRGRLVPLHGPARTRPDSMQLRVDFSTRFKWFTVGMKNLVGDFVITTAPTEHAWTLVWRKEPHWDLPLITEKLLRTPLRRPFEGTGVIFHIGVRDSADAQTLLERRAHGVVQESAILRFLNALGSSALSDLADRTEREEEQFFRELFVALHADARALAPSLGTATDEKASAADP